MNGNMFFFVNVAFDVGTRYYSSRAILVSLK